MSVKLDFLNWTPFAQELSPTIDKKEFNKKKKTNSFSTDKETIKYLLNKYLFVKQSNIK